MIDAPDYGALTKQLKALRHAELLLCRALNLLNDAKNAAREAGWQMRARHIAGHATSLKDEILIEITTGVADLERRIREG